MTINYNNIISSVILCNKTDHFSVMVGKQDTVYGNNNKLKRETTDFMKLNS